MPPVTKSNRHSAVTAYRQGEGVLVDMEITPVTSVSGQAGAVMRANLANLPVPDRHYSADACFVCYEHETVYILFAQRRLDNSDLRNLLIVKMTPASVKIYLDALINPANASMESIAEFLGIQVEDLPKFSAEPKESITLNASIIIAGVSGREGCLDFYYASPFSKSAVSLHKKLALDPVVRVDLRTALLIGLNRTLSKLLEGLPDAVVNEVGYVKTGAGNE